MKKVFILYSLLYSALLGATVLVSPVEAMREHYAPHALIGKKNILLSKKNFTQIQQNAKAKLNTKIYRIYTAKVDGKVLGFGILINHKVRSKNAVILYFISKNILEDIEIIAFNEPKEYLPTKKWTAQFHNISTDKMLKLSREIPSISGATLSARSVTDSSRIAFAIYNQLLKGQ
jgi:hypothetical protein